MSDLYDWGSVVSWSWGMVWGWGWVVWSSSGSTSHEGRHNSKGIHYGLINKWLSRFNMRTDAETQNNQDFYSKIEYVNE